MTVDDHRGSRGLILASASPRRLELARLLGLAVVVRPAHVDESPLPDEPARGYVERLARAKAEAAAAAGPSSDVFVLGADTAVVIDLDGPNEEILGKPTDGTDAARMLGLLSGRTHHVLTGVAVSADGQVRAEVVSSAVTFHALDESEVTAYVRSGDWADKAGGYAVQGLGASLVGAVDGCVDNVVGLPMRVVRRLLSDV